MTKDYRKRFKGKGSPLYKRIKINCSHCGKELLRIAHRVGHFKYQFCDRVCQGKWQSKNKVGENAFHYTNGKTPLITRIRSSRRMEKWRKAVFMRDNFIDQKYKQKGDFLNAHHIITFSELLRKHNIQTLEQSKNCMELWDISNGITLSKKSHLDFHKIYGLKNNNREQLNEFLNSEKSKVV